MKTKNKPEKLSSAWISAGESLTFRIDAPFSIKNSNGDEVSCIAYLPDFGGPKGMVIGIYCPPEYDVENDLVTAAKSREYFYSFINFEVYEHFNGDVFKEALADWGFFGDGACRPKWMETWSPDAHR